MKKTPSPESIAELERIERYLASDPGNAHLLASAIDLSLETGRIDSARRHADAAMAHLPADKFMAHRNGNVLIAEGKLDEAAAVFQSLLTQTPDAAIAYNLALVYFRQGQHAKARTVLEPYIASDDAACAAVTLFMRNLHHLRSVEEAIALARQHAAHCAHDDDFLATGSLLYLDDNQLPEAQRWSDAALALGGRPLEALVVAGSVALGRGDADGAVPLFTEALAFNPLDGRSWSGLGMASLLKGDLDNAGEQLQRATSAMPTHIGTLHALGWCQILRRELPGAEQSFRKALDLDRNFGESHGGLAVVSALQGEKREAEEFIERALRLDPQGLSAKYAQMVLSGDVDDPVRFKRLAQRVLSSRTGPFAASLADAFLKRMH